jgi:hypothetical protein
MLDMSNFYCEHCGAICCDSLLGYTTGCQHHLPDTYEFKRLLHDLTGVVKNPREYVLVPQVGYDQKSLLDLWNAGQYVECDTIVYHLTSGDRY